MRLNKENIFACVWGFAEGTVFFVVPDVLVSYGAMFSLRRMAATLLASLIGSAAAAAVMYVWAAAEPQTARHFVLSMPFVTAKMMASADAGLAHDSLVALLLAPASGHPFKIYAALAPAYTGFVAFLLTGMAARALRFAAVGGFAHLAARVLRRTVSALDSRKLSAIWAVCWIVFYSVYWYGILSS